MRSTWRSIRLALATETVGILAAPNTRAEAVARFADAPVIPAQSVAPSAPSPPYERGPELPSAIVVGAGPPRSGSEQLSDRAARFLEAGKITEAIGAYSESIRLDPTNGGSLLSLGRLRARLGEDEEAEMLFSTAARYPSVESVALTERAHLRRRLGREAEAVSDLEVAVRLGPDDAARSEELSAWYVARRSWLPALAVWRRTAAGADGDELGRRATIQVKALSVLAADLDVVRAGAAVDRPWTRRALARLEDRVVGAAAPAVKTPWPRRTNKKSDPSRALALWRSRGTKARGTTPPRRPRRATGTSRSDEPLRRRE